MIVDIARMLGLFILNAVAVLWIRWVKGASPDRWDLISSALALPRMAIIFFGPRGI